MPDDDFANDVEFYFVISDEEAPKQIFFSLEAAIKMGFDYIDSFNHNGIHLHVYKLIYVKTSDYDYPVSTGEYEKLG